MFPPFRVLMSGDVPFVTNDTQWSLSSPTVPVTHDFPGHDVAQLSTQAALIPTRAEERPISDEVAQVDD